MVWFQCEDCGENLKKPKLPNHFRICSANKLSCIDCGEIFNQQSVQGHTQCITEAEKYGPKDHGKSSQNAPSKTNKLKKNLDVDVNVGLSSRAPWFCSLCKTNTTSQQTLLLHADGKKHRAKAKAFHASQQKPDQAEEITKASTDSGLKIAPVEANDTKHLPVANDVNSLKMDDFKPDLPEEKEGKSKKRKVDSSAAVTADHMDGCPGDLSNGEVIQAENGDAQNNWEKNKRANAESDKEGQMTENGLEKHAIDSKIKWKKIIVSILKSNPDGFMKTKKLQKHVLKTIREDGVTEDKSKLQDTFMHKITSSSRFVIEGKRVGLTVRGESS
ncbi:hypothetical protein QJS10_CPB20g00425 [Acorus calamus]|uniref:U1-type domain-containing protein n=1 Tax=Acorus calamus TaxID=4465 RepID=A0AAV9C9F5_ACOCL|nr:hypothetical protein QJS10_CPB20g00425 [Acorus calamus]